MSRRPLGGARSAPPGSRHCPCGRAGSIYEEAGLSVGGAGRDSLQGQIGFAQLSGLGHPASAIRRCTLRPVLQRTTLVRCREVGRVGERRLARPTSRTGDRGWRGLIEHGACVRSGSRIGCGREGSLRGCVLGCMDQHLQRSDRQTKVGGRRLTDSRVVSLHDDLPGVGNVRARVRPWVERPPCLTSVGSF